ncbi:MAG: AAA family ATPase [Actinomycetota bacterium]|nr:AAA family ATPase [Actinomycetota bacterium]
MNYENSKTSFNVPENQRSHEEVGILLSDVQAEKVMWLWDRRIPLAKLTLIEGDPDHGKSVITCDISARVTRGTGFPLGDLGQDGSVGDLGILGGVVMLNAEDAPGDTIRPRMEAAGADLEKVCVLPAMLPDSRGEERLFSIPKDVPIIERAIEQVDAKLVVIDPLSAFMQGDPNKDSDVRKALTPLSKMAERTGVAIVVVRYFNKNVDTNALYRGGGSIGIVGAARSAMAVALHPDDEDQRVLVPQKGNLSKKAPAITYIIVEAENGYPCIEWGEPVNLDAKDVLNPSRTKGKVDEAADWLKKYLADGPIPADDVKAAAEEANIKARTLERAKPKAGVESYKDGDKWYWHLPKIANNAKDAKDANGAKVA